MGVNLDKEIVDKFKKIGLRDDKKLNVLHKEALLEYIQNHGDGNSAFTLDQFTDQSMIATPAFGRDIRIWAEYVNSVTEDGEKEIFHKAHAIADLVNKKQRYGSALVIVN